MSDAAERIAEVVRGADLTAPNLLSELDEGALVSDVVILVKYVDTEGRVGLSMAWPKGQDWIARRGMIETLRDMERLNPNDGDTDA